MSEVAGSGKGGSDIRDVVVADRAEWAVMEGFVGRQAMPNKIVLPSDVADALNAARGEVLRVTTDLNTRLGSFVYPLDISVLAGRRTVDDNAVIIPSMAVYGLTKRRVGHNDAAKLYPIPGLNPGEGCLSDIQDHTDGLSVDVALVCSVTRRLFGSVSCYGAFSSDHRPPRSFPAGVIYTTSVQNDAARDILVGAMNEAGFSRPDGKRPWHFEFSRG